jgi:ectoine hydroxylase-related dioxygenase (phytanoyl-CoA dioxygenase family)
VRLRAVYTLDEIARLDEALTRAQRRISRLPGDADKSLTRDGFLSRHSSKVAAYVMDPKLGALAARLLGTTRIRLIHDVMVEKSLGHGGTPWHRDSDFWSFTGIGALTMWIPLQETPLSMSPLRYASGSHLGCNQHPLHPVEQALIPIRFRVSSSPLAVGDVAVHHFKTLHGAGRNHELRPRRALAVHLIDADARFLFSEDSRHIEHARRCGWDRLNDRDTFTDAIAPLVFSTQGPVIVSEPLTARRAS